MRQLKPIYDFDSYSKPVEKVIYQYLYDLIYRPLLEIVKPTPVKLNAVSSALREALLSGKLTYVDGYFVGSLTAEISKELRRAGAVYNKTKKAYKLEQKSLPLDLKVTISEANGIQKDKAKKVQDYLKAMEGRDIPPIGIDPLFQDTVQKLDKQFHATTKNITGKELEVPLEPRLKEELSAAYTANLDMYIKDWYDEAILRLRQKVEENVSEGFRAENLIDTIQAEKSVSHNKAKFLAKQETSLMVSKYRQIRYQDIGIQYYTWSTAHDPRVRKDHKELQGKVFRFDEPPITNKQTGARNNPGEDFGCRCIAIPSLTEKGALRKDLANV